MLKDVNVSDIINKTLAGLLVTVATFLAHSISQLNEKVAIVIERVMLHEKRLDNVENRFDKLYLKEK